MGTVPWQLIAVEDAEAETIDLKTGATLLGKGQRATPGLDDDNVSRVAARIQVGPGRIHFTSMAHPGFLRITPADTGMARKLVRYDRYGQHNRFECTFQPIHIYVGGAHP